MRMAQRYLVLTRHKNAAQEVLGKAMEETEDGIAVVQAEWEDRCQQVMWTDTAARKLDIASRRSDAASRRSDAASHRSHAAAVSQRSSAKLVSFQPGFNLRSESSNLRQPPSRQTSMRSSNRTGVSP